MKILIIEDTPSKKCEIEEVLARTGLELLVESVSCVVDGIHLLIPGNFDLVILDVVIPFDRDDQASPENCNRFLQLVKAQLRSSSPFFVLLTGQMDKFADVEDDLKAFGWSTLEYRVGGNWQKPLTNIVKTIESGLARIPKPHACDVVWIVALRDSEFAGVRNLNLTWTEISVDHDPTVYYETTIEVRGKRRKIVLGCAVSMGQVHAAELCSRMLRTFMPRLVVMTGIAGGVEDRCKIGDIVIAKSVFDYGSGKILEDSNGIYLDPAPNDIPCNAVMLDQISRFIETNSWISTITDLKARDLDQSATDIHFEPVASGANVIGTKKVVAEIVRRNRKVVGIDMEAYALFHSCRSSIFPAASTFVCKSITDFADIHKDDRYRLLASDISAVIGYEFCKFWLAQEINS